MLTEVANARVNPATWAERFNRMFALIVGEFAKVQGPAAVGPGLPAELADAVATSKARRARRREIWVEQACGKYFPVLSFFQQLSMGAKDDDRHRASGHADDGDRARSAAPRSPPNARGRDHRALSAWQAAPRAGRASGMDDGPDLVAHHPHACSLTALTGGSASSGPVPGPGSSKPSR